LGKTFSQLQKDDPHRSNINILHIACQEGLVETITLCLELRPDLIYGKSEAKWTPLMNACEAGEIEAIELLILYELDQLNYVCESGSAIHAAITGKDPFNTVSFLLEHKP
jgi:ankyrin repeat protein